jgi:hypothetical protein
MIRILTAVIPAVLVAGCGTKKDWDTELIVQLFRPRLLEVAKVTVRATQAGKTRSLELANPFASCTANQLRIIPARTDADVEIVASSAAPRLEGHAVVKPSQREVKLVLGTAPELEPAGCAPASRPDAGTKAQTGMPCSRNEDCVGGICLSTVKYAYPEPAFVGGYCSAPCTTECSSPGDSCLSFKNANGAEVAAYCMLRCAADDACRKPEGYGCTTGGLCFPGK